MHKIVQFILLLSLLTSGVLSQNSTSSVNIIVPTTTSAAAPTPSTSEPTNGDEDVQPDPILCTPGNSVGYMIIRKPNITSHVTVGMQYNVTWDWSITVTKLPSYVDVYIQLVAPGIATTWKKQVAKEVSTEPRWFFWKPEGLVDGKYKLRLVPEGKETYNVPANVQPCFSNGEAIPSVSAAFTVTNSKGDLSSYPDQFPPNAAKKQMLLDSKVVWMTCIVFGIWMLM